MYSQFASRFRKENYTVSPHWKTHRTVWPPNMQIPSISSPYSVRFNDAAMSCCLTRSSEFDSSLLLAFRLAFHLWPAKERADCEYSIRCAFFLDPKQKKRVLFFCCIFWLCLRIPFPSLTRKKRSVDGEFFKGPLFNQGLFVFGCFEEKRQKNRLERNGLSIRFF